MLALARAVAAALVMGSMAWAGANGPLVLRLNPAAIELWRVTEGEFLRGRYSLGLQLSPACTQEFWGFTDDHIGVLLELRVTEGLSLTVVIQAPINSGSIGLPAVATEAEAHAQLEELEQAIAEAEAGECFLPVAAP